MENEVQHSAGTPPAPVKAGVIVLVAECLAMLATIFLGGPLALVVIILAVICMTRNRVKAGILLTVGSLVLGGIFYLIGWLMVAGGMAAVAAPGLENAHNQVIQKQQERQQQDK